MSSAIYSMKVYQGETVDSLSKAFTWKIGGVPVDLTDFFVEFEVRRTGATALSLAKWNTTNGKLITGGVSGTIALNLTAAETFALWEPQLVKVDLDSYLLGSYSLEATSLGGRVQRLLTGPFLIVPKVYAA